MKHWQIPLITFAALFVSLALAEDFKTTNGKEYKNATVTLVEPDGITLRSKSGVSKVYFNERPKEVQERFHYDPQKAAAASAEQAAPAGDLSDVKTPLLKQQSFNPAVCSIWRFTGNLNRTLSLYGDVAVQRNGAGCRGTC